MMNGKDKLAIVAGFIAGIFIARIYSNKTLNDRKSEPSLFQYLNRFSEFFDSEHIPEVQDMFFYLVDSGLRPDQAFMETINKVKT